MKQSLSGGMKVAIYIITLIFIYFGAVSINTQYVNQDTATTIITYLQTVLTLLIGYYWGSSSKNKQTKGEELVNDSINNESYNIVTETLINSTEEVEKKGLENVKE